MSAKKITSPQTNKCHPTSRGHDIKTIQKLEFFTSTNAKINKSSKHQLTYVTEQIQVNCLTNKVSLKNGQNHDREKIINQLLQENLKLKEQNDQKNKLIEMLIDERTDIKRVTSLHIPHERDIQQSKTNFRLQSPNHMEFTFYKSPSRGLPKEFQITPSRKMFF
ncbi:unnamed protein product (macronuclear) [Paramecium tetraurelia]|uniref:Uncharacterized protein n=1 Tax=Paramecium tetraurelia TaxID=5888 RepID=A0D473_PARTE|nr:uncharacterized protein GSPATT00013306001 [Paramecium tetraurelia]CAK77840.1 unnamed protein product [Paramecium tetraurelia]|eukprot:XP_001445237.1 hypothetical protein (macronuclear) [Paramecium tetraurelia strain d4-2]